MIALHHNPVLSSATHDVVSHHLAYENPGEVKRPLQIDMEEGVKGGL